MFIHLLEPDVELKGDGFSGAADGRDRVFQMLGRRAGNQLHRVRSGVVSHLQGEAEAGDVPAAPEKTHPAQLAHVSAWFHLTAKSEVKVHSWTGWLYVGSLLTEVRLKVRPGWSTLITMDDNEVAG